MLTLPRWIILYGAGLIAFDRLDAVLSVDLGLEGRSLVCGWIGGVILLACGVASNQRRRSLRLGGLYTAVGLAIAMVGFFAWDATDAWLRAARTGAPLAPAVSATLWVGITIALLAVITRLRPREGIASRGYAVPLPPRPLKPASLEAISGKRRSSAG
jgi:hypothetical protein